MTTLLIMGKVATSVRSHALVMRSSSLTWARGETSAKNLQLGPKGQAVPVAAEYLPLETVVFSRLFGVEIIIRLLGVSGQEWAQQTRPLRLGPTFTECCPFECVEVGLDIIILR